MQLKYLLVVIFSVFVLSIFGQAKADTIATHDSTLSKLKGDADKEIYTEVETPPRFPGGNKALREYLSNNIQYPVKALKKRLEGTVVLQFVVTKTGTVDDIKVLRGVHSSLDSEAIRVVKLLPKWEPGIKDGHAVNVYYWIPIKFELPFK
jgi:protein TonB